MPKNSLRVLHAQTCEMAYYLVLATTLAEGQSGSQDTLLLLMLVLTFIEHLHCAKVPC